LLVALLVWGGLYYRSRLQSRRLTDKDTIVIADFANSTGDPVFDGTLRQGLSAQLEQSPFLSALSDRRVAQTLALMAQPKDARLTRDLAVEVCQRTASTASIEGSISSLGAQYVLGLRAVNCRSGDLLANEQGTANGKEQVLQALGQLATELREKLGEPKVSVLKYDVPVEEVTTPSLTALHAYSLGSQAVERDDEPAAVPLLQRATLLDPHFAMAYARLGACYENLGESKRADENYRKAYDLRERVSERENLSIVSNYEEGDSQNLDAARKAYELWVQTYPRDDTPLINLGVVYGTLGDYDKGLETTQAAIRLNRVGISYANLASFYMHLNRMDEARATIQEAQAKNLDSPLLHATLYHIDFFHHDAAGMERERAWLVAKPGWEDQVFSLEYSTSAYRGQFAKAREFSRRAADAARREDEGDTSSGLVAGNAEDEALVGNTGLARQQAHAALARSHGINVEEASAVALGLAGDGARAMQLAADLAKRFPEGTTTQLEFVPMIRASVALQSGSAGKALDALAPAAIYELGDESRLYPAYLRGNAYLAAGQGSAAKTEFQKILDHPGVVNLEIIGALAHLQIGRAYAMQGDSAKAKAAYQDFLNLWKDADPDIPILKEAKAEYAKLH
jgi:tetratricopeptide (TPR) repeat protein